MRTYHLDYDLKFTCLTDLYCAAIYVYSIEICLITAYFKYQNSHFTKELNINIYRKSQERHRI